MLPDYRLPSTLADLLPTNAIVSGSLASYVTALNELRLRGLNYWRFDASPAIPFELSCRWSSVEVMICTKSEMILFSACLSFLSAVIGV